MHTIDRVQWRIEEFPEGGAPTPIVCAFPLSIIFAENCMKMKEFGPPGGGASLVTSLDPPMELNFFKKKIWWTHALL